MAGCICDQSGLTLSPVHLFDELRQGALWTGERLLAHFVCGGYGARGCRGQAGVA